MSTAEPSEEELRAAWEEQLRRVTPADVIVQTVVSLVSLAGRRLGVDPGTEDERDLAQVADAIDAARALLPVLERREDPANLRSVRDALAGLQMEYARIASSGGGEAGGSDGNGGGGEGGGGGAPGGPPPPAAPEAGQPSEPGPGPAQRSGRLWVPGQ